MTNSEQPTQETLKIPRIIQEQVTLFESIKQDYLALIPHYNVALELTKAHPKNFFSIGISIYHCTIYYKCKDLAEVAPLLRFLSKKGYKQTGGITDNSQAKSRSWNCGRIHLTSYFSQEDANCKFVKIGEEPRPPRPIYELQCGPQL